MQCFVLGEVGFGFLLITVIELVRSALKEGETKTGTSHVYLCQC